MRRGGESDFTIALGTLREGRQVTELQKTVLHARHVGLGAKMVEFGGWDMPLHYETGIVDEHLMTRRYAGLFDVSHMGRFTVRGAGALAFLQRVLTNDAAALAVGSAQYTVLANEGGGAIDDAYLYRFVEGEYLVVVNASNRQKDWEHLETERRAFESVEMTDDSKDLAMISLQGPRSQDMLVGAVGGGELPRPKRNALSIVTMGGTWALVARTGYTGEPVCFELFVPSASAGAVWDLLIARGAGPVGLGARDTLRLEAGLPLYGHELGPDAEGRDIPIFASSVARRAVSFAEGKGDFVGRVGARAAARGTPADQARRGSVGGRAAAGHHADRRSGEARREGGGERAVGRRADNRPRDQRDGCAVLEDEERGSIPSTWLGAGDRVFRRGRHARHRHGACRRRMPSGAGGAGGHPRTRGVRAYRGWAPADEPASIRSRYHT